MPPITRAQLVNQKDLTMDELAKLADTIMLSQANVQSVLAEVDADRHNADRHNADRHNADVLAVRQWPAAPPPPRNVLSTKGEYSLNRIHRLLEHEFPDIAGLQPFNHPPPAAQVYHSVDTADTTPIHC